MASESDALEATLLVIQRDENDYNDEATETAYKSVPNEFTDEDVKNKALLEFFRSEPNLFDFDGA